MRVNRIEANRRCRSDSLKVAYSGNDEYRGIVYIATLSDKNGENDWVEHSCYIDELLDKLDKLRIDIISSSKNKKNVYITNNTFKTFRGRTENDNEGEKAGLFSYNNIVIDIDCHDKNISSSQNYTIMHSLSLILEEELKDKIPMFNIIHFTGRGIQLWWCFEQVSTKLKFFYRTAMYGLVEEINRILNLDKCSEFSCVHIDGTTTKENGYFRLFDTYNTHASKYSMSVIKNENIYKLQELFDSVSDNLDFSKKIKINNENKEVPVWTQFNIQNRKRMNLIESLVRDRTKSVGSRDNYLFIYYNCARGIYGSDLAQKKANYLNDSFDTPLSKNEVSNIFKEVDARYKSENPYFFKNSTIIEWFNITEEEQEKYNFKPAGLGDFNGSERIQNRTRDEERRIRREIKEYRIINLYVSGMTQEEVSKELGCSRPTVSKLLKKHNISRKQENIRNIQLLKADGCIQTEVSNLLGLGIATVKRYWNVSESL